MFPSFHVKGLGTFFDCFPTCQDLLETIVTDTELDTLNDLLNATELELESIFEEQSVEETASYLTKDGIKPVELYMATDFEPVRTSGWEHINLSIGKNTIKNDDKDELEGNNKNLSYVRASTLLGKTKYIEENVLNNSCTIKTEQEKNDGEEQDEAESLYNEFKKTISKHVIRTILSMRITLPSSVHEDDIVGLDSVKKMIREKVINPIQRPDLHCGLCEAAKGVLLFGSPGTGKTMVAKWIATDSKACFFLVTPSSLLTKFYGETEMTIKALFLIAQKYAPTVLFIDEIDALFGKRDERDQEANIRMKNELLQGMDGANVSLKQTIIVVGATNRPEALDPAAIRRFVRRIMIPLPEFQTRKDHIQRLLRFHHMATTGTQVDSLLDSELNELAQKLNGWSASDIKTLCMRAADFPYQEALSHYGSLSNIPNATIFRCINYKDFRKALNDVRPSSSLEEEKRLFAWQNTFGSL